MLTTEADYFEGPAGGQIRYGGGLLDPRDSFGSSSNAAMSETAYHRVSSSLSMNPDVDLCDSVSFKNTVTFMRKTPKGLVEHTVVTLSHRQPAPQKSALASSVVIGKRFRRVVKRVHFPSDLLPESDEHFAQNSFMKLREKQLDLQPLRNLPRVLASTLQAGQDRAEEFLRPASSSSQLAAAPLPAPITSIGDSPLSVSDEIYLQQQREYELRYANIMHAAIKAGPAGVPASGLAVANGRGSNGLANSTLSTSASLLPSSRQGDRPSSASGVSVPQQAANMNGSLSSSYTSHSVTPGVAVNGEVVRPQQQASRTVVAPRVVALSGKVSPNKQMQQPQPVAQRLSADYARVSSASLAESGATASRMQAFAPVRDESEPYSDHRTLASTSCATSDNAEIHNYHQAALALLSNQPAPSLHPGMAVPSTGNLLPYDHALRMHDYAQQYAIGGDYANQNDVASLYGKSLPGSLYVSQLPASVSHAAHHAAGGDMHAHDDDVASSVGSTLNQSDLFNDQDQMARLYTQVRSSTVPATYGVPAIQQFATATAPKSNGFAMNNANVRPVSSGNGASGLRQLPAFMRATASSSTRQTELDKERAQKQLEKQQQQAKIVREASPSRASVRPLSVSTANRANERNIDENPLMGEVDFAKLLARSRPVSSSTALRRTVSPTPSHRPSTLSPGSQFRRPATAGAVARTPSQARLVEQASSTNLLRAMSNARLDDIKNNNVRPADASALNNIATPARSPPQGTRLRGRATNNNGDAARASLVALMTSEVAPGAVRPAPKASSSRNVNGQREMFSPAPRKLTRDQSEALISRLYSPARPASAAVAPVPARSSSTAALNRTASPAQRPSVVGVGFGSSAKRELVPSSVKEPHARTSTPLRASMSASVNALPQDSQRGVSARDSNAASSRTTLRPLPSSSAPAVAPLQPTHARQSITSPSATSSARETHNPDHIKKLSIPKIRAIGFLEYDPLSVSSSPRRVGGMRSDPPSPRVGTPRSARLANMQQQIEEKKMAAAESLMHMQSMHMQVSQSIQQQLQMAQRVMSGEIPPETVLSARGSRFSPVHSQMNGGIPQAHAPNMPSMSSDATSAASGSMRDAPVSLAPRAESASGNGAMVVSPSHPAVAFSTSSFPSLSGGALAMSSASAGGAAVDPAEYQRRMMERMIEAASKASEMIMHRRREAGVVGEEAEDYGKLGSEIYHQTAGAQ